MPHANTFAYIEPCARKPVGESLSLLDQHRQGTIRQLVCTQHSAYITDRGFEDTDVAEI